jgi:hypothetical protein
VPASNIVYPQATSAAALGFDRYCCSDHLRSAELTAASTRVPFFIELQMGNRPIAFESYSGQIPGTSNFVGGAARYSAFLTAEMVLSLEPTATPQLETISAPIAQPSKRRTLFQFNPVRTAASPAVIGEMFLPGWVHYFLGHDLRPWRTNVPSYARVRYKAVDSGIDVIYYGHSQLSLWYGQGRNGLVDSFSLCRRYNRRPAHRAATPSAHAYRDFCDAAPLYPTELARAMTPLNTKECI